MRILSSNISLIKQTGKKTVKKAFLSSLNVLHKIVGTSSTQNIVKQAENISYDILDLRCKKSVFTPDDISKIIEKNLGKKAASNFGIVSDKSLAANILEEYYNLSKEDSVDIVNYCTAMVIPGTKNQKHYLFIPREILNNPSPLDISIIAHEMEHVSYTSTSLFMKFYNFVSQHSKKETKQMASFSKLNDEIYKHTINQNNKYMYRMLETLDLKTLLKLLINAKEEYRANLVEENIYNFINTKYKLAHDANRVSYHRHFENTQKMIEEIILKKHLHRLPDFMANFILKIIN